MQQPDPQDGLNIAYETPDVERTASSAPTERQLENGRHDPYAALRFREYRLFSTGWMTSVIGSQILAAAIGWEIYDRTHDPLLVGWVAGIQFIPLVLLALPGGQLADVLDRRRIITTCAVVTAATSAVLAWLSYRPGSIPWMYAALFCNAASQTLGRPARSALLPHLVPPWAFSNAVTWNSSFFQLSAMVGPALGGFALASHHRLPYLLDAGCSLVFGLVAALLPARRVIRDSAARSMWREVGAGLQFVINRPIILATLTLDLFAVLLGGAVYLLPVIAKDVLYVGEIQFGMLRAAEAVGAVTMAMLIAHLPPMKRAGRAMLLAVAGFGVATIVFGLSRNYYLSLAMLFLIGAFDNISVVVRHTLVQVLTPDSMRGRVSAVNNIFIGSSNELGGLESGITAKWWTAPVAIVVGGVGTIVTVLAVALVFPQLRRFGSLAHARPENHDASAPRLPGPTPAASE